MAAANTEYVTANETDYKIIISNAEPNHAGNWMDVIRTICNQCTTYISQEKSGNWTKIFNGIIDVTGALPTESSEIAIYRHAGDPTDSATEQCMKNMLQPSSTQNAISEGAIAAFIIIGAVLLIFFALLSCLLLRSYPGSVRGLTNNIVKKLPFTPKKQAIDAPIVNAETPLIPINKVPQ